MLKIITLTNRKGETKKNENGNEKEGKNVNSRFIADLDSPVQLSSNFF